MIKMVDKDGDGQVCFEEFYKMVTGGRKPPPGLGRRRNSEHFSPTHTLPKRSVNRRDTLAAAQAAAEARNSKRKILDDFAKEYNLKPESIKSAHKRYLSMDKNKTGLINYIEFCDILQLDPSLKCESVFWQFDYRNTGMAEAKEILISLANFTGAGKDDK
jgi:serine/threonine-protein phosphatase 2B regulatory subunit